MPDTCEAGHECMREVETAMRKRIEEKWAEVLASIKAQIEATLAKTEKLLEDAWTE